MHSEQQKYDHYDLQAVFVKLTYTYAELGR